MAVAIIVAIFGALSSGTEGFVIAFGIVCCAGGLICLAIGVLVAIAGRDRELARALLLSAGITFLIGTGVCSTLLI